MDGDAGRQHGTAPSGAPAVPFGRSSSRPGEAGGAVQSFDDALRVETSSFGPSLSHRVRDSNLTCVLASASGLQELKDLQSQLHQAADCCEEAFLNTGKKKLILESTKSYICDAVVAVIDHLGNVSSKLEHQLQDKTEITQTEQKINVLKQRFLTCEQYAISLKLLTVREDTDAVQYHRRYLSQSTERTKKENGANSSKDDLDYPFKIISPTSSGATRTLKPYDVQPTIGGEGTVSDAYVGNPTAVSNSFSFRAEGVQMIVPGDHKKKKKKKTSHGSNILSYLKKSRRHA